MYWTCGTLILLISGIKAGVFLKPGGVPVAPPMNAPANAKTGNHLHWGYKDLIDEEPPTAWEKDYPSCKGTFQSPISINRSVVQLDPTLKPLRFSNYHEHPVDNTWTILDNGHSVQFNATFPAGKTPTITTDRNNDSFALTQFHFHWGSDDSRGSEHVVDGKRYPLELHLVHQKTTEDAAAAGKDTTGLAVVAVMFSLAGPKDHPNIFLNMITEALEQAKPVPDKPITRKLSFLNLAVLWTIMKPMLKISEKQINIFRHLHGKADDPKDLLEDNFRPIQDVHGRIIKAYSADPSRKGNDVVKAATALAAERKKV
ncbi:putative Carbonic anhydrase 2 [Hypsibius exemplaris]|uniref:Carbonic anhydrase n=1 Tax=Hypsibius exemplaris TaxID=2072580 RepID=A0A9X6NGV1_HYPEX|nr:putative Carbonic anhydrase 2 [Hypsibius exemplaris]